VVPRDATLLVVEDDQDHALLVRIAARRAFPLLDVRVAGDGREGIAYLAGTPPFQDRVSHPFPDLVLLDLLMPHVDGFEFLAWMGDRNLLDTLPVVVLTSSVNPGDQDRALALGAKAFHSKPASLDILNRIVREIVGEWIR
jgi:CheY-like chemotaxis protein